MSENKSAEKTGESQPEQAEVEKAQDPENQMKEEVEEKPIEAPEDVNVAVEVEIEKVILEEVVEKEGEEDLEVPLIAETMGISIETVKGQAPEEEPQDPTSLFNKQLKDLLKVYLVLTVDLNHGFKVD